ncbi:Circadian clock protein KaiC (fragment) [Candidatus Methylobacter favarea]|uniref:Circadian clock protein KaiC n=1 Tax=Candidatus Methylobacter favarea TaxID=2707345 RepID=A0A8S0WB93_9GAMM
MQTSSGNRRNWSGHLLGEGLPEFSFNLIAGTQGSRKTTLAQQIMVSLATPDNRTPFFTVPGEPALKMLRYQQQFLFFVITKVTDSIRFFNLTADLQEGNLDRLLSRFRDEVKDYAPPLFLLIHFDQSHGQRCRKNR